jgi:4,5-dihydroxyphthalate decarboxylase
MFSDGGRAVVETFFRKTGIVPVNHVIVAQRRLLEQHADLAAELFRLFSASKQAAYEKDDRRGPGYLYFEGTDAATQAATYGEDPFAFGIKRNRPMLEMLFRCSHEEGLTRKLAAIEDVFFKGLLNT